MQRLTRSVPLAHGTVRQGIEPDVSRYAVKGANG